MDDDGFLSSRRVAILGLGLMGGSLALALRGRVTALFAADPDPATRALAIEKKIVDRISADPTEIIDQADVIILAAPVEAILAHIRTFSDWIATQRTNLPSEGIIVLDLGSTKQVIVDAMRSLPDGFDPLGGHPMCGKETAGLAYADAAIYQDAPFAFTALERTGTQARRFAELLADAIGAIPLWIDPATHDRWVSATSHLPYLLANILAGVTPLEAAPLIGPGFRSTSRLASSSLTMILDILRTNRPLVLEAVRRFRDHLEVVENSLNEGDFAALSDLLAEAARRHQSLLQAKIGERKSST